MKKATGTFLRGSGNVVLLRKEDISKTYEAGCYGSSASTGSLKPLFMRTTKRRFRDLDASSSWVEPWKLSLVESFYMVQNGELEIYMDGAENMLTEEQAWEEFCKSSANTSSENFACMYAAYRQLKEDGWVVKMGSTYGANFVVYQGDLDKFHSLFCVLVRNTNDPNPLDWIEVTREMRVANQTGKEVMLFDVTLTEPSTKAGCTADIDIVYLLRWMLKHEEAGKERKPHKAFEKKLLDPSQKTGPKRSPSQKQKERQAKRAKKVESKQAQQATSVSSADGASEEKDLTLPN